MGDDECKNDGTWKKYTFMPYVHTLQHKKMSELCGEKLWKHENFPLYIFNKLTRL